MMPYEILTFVTPNAKYQRERFTFKCRNFDLEIDLSAFINIHIYILIQSLSYLETFGTSPCWNPSKSGGI